MTWDDVGSAALGLISIVMAVGAIVGRALIPVGIELLRERLLSSRNARVAAAAETVAAELRTGLLPNTGGGVDALRARLPETLDALGNPNTDVLRGLIAKGAERLKAPAPAKAQLP